MDQIVSEYPPPLYRLAHLSDVHLPGERGLLYGAADADHHLGALLAALADSGTHLDAVVFSGDLADRGEAGSYERLSAMMAEFTERVPVPIVWAMGNHDERGALRRVLLGAEPSAEPLDHVLWVKGLRIIALDTTIPGRHDGAVTPQQRAWLAEQLTTPAPDGTVLVMHHPPLPTVLEHALTVELRGQADLAPVLEGTDVRAILAGHVHHSSFGTFAGIPVSVASSTAYTQDLTVDAGGIRGQDGGQSLNLVDVHERTIVHTVVPIGRYATVGEFIDPATSAERLAAAGITRPARQET